MELSEKQRIEIIKFVIAQPLFLGDLQKEEGGIVEFLEMIWELRTMPSFDERFHTAYEDAWQHLVRNDDWEYRYTIGEYASLENIKIWIFLRNLFRFVCIHLYFQKKKSVENWWRELMPNLQRWVFDCLVLIILRSVSFIQ